MSIIVKNCLRHGELTQDQVKIRADNGYLRCKLCMRESEKRRKRPDDHYEKYSKIKSREWRQKNASLVNERVKEDRLKDPEKYREYDRKQRREDLEGHRYRDVLTKHKISHEDYSELLAFYNNLCAICNSPETKLSRTPGNICRLAIDHCHKCENDGIKGVLAIRGLLCHSCNTAIGKFKDNPNLLQSAIDYLKKHEHQL